MPNSGSVIPQVQVIDPIANYGCTFDHRVVFDGATTGATGIITSATAAFTTQDIGKRIVLTGAGAGTAPNAAQYVGTITSLNSGTSVNVTPNTTNTVSAKGLQIHTDDLQSWTNLITDLNNSPYPGAIILMRAAWTAAGFTNRSGISSILPAINKTVQIIGIGGGHTTDVGDYTRIGGTCIAYAGTTVDGGTAIDEKSRIEGFNRSITDAVAKPTDLKARVVVYSRSKSDGISTPFDTVNHSTGAVTAYGIWIQYAFLSGTTASIGYRQPTFVSLLAGVQDVAPEPTSPMVRVPVAAPTPEAPPQGPVGSGVGYKPPVLEVQGDPAPPDPPVVVAGPTPTATSLRTAPELELPPGPSPVLPTAPAPAQGPTPQGSRTTAPVVAPAPRAPEPAPAQPTPTQGPTPNKRG